MLFIFFSFKLDFYLVCVCGWWWCSGWWVGMEVRDKLLSGSVTVGLRDESQAWQQMALPAELWC